MPIREGAFDSSAWKAIVGLKSTDKIGFYGTTPVAQRALAAQALSLASAGSWISVTSNLAAWAAEVTSTLTGLGLWKGSA
jgi:hypothetical protein